MTVRDFPRLTDEQKQTVVLCSQSSEAVRDEIILSPLLQGKIQALAYRYAKYARHRMNGVIEQEDLVQSANVAMLNHFSRALSNTHTYAYLMIVAKLAMIDCINGRSDSIRVCNHLRYPLISMISLDQPATYEHELPLSEQLTVDVYLGSSQREENWETLYQAIERLPEKQRLVIQQHYGIGEYAPESLNEISRSFSTSANHHHRHALAALRAALASPSLQSSQEVPCE